MPSHCMQQDGYQINASRTIVKLPVYRSLVPHTLSFPPRWRRRIVRGWTRRRPSTSCRNHPGSKPKPGSHPPFYLWWVTNTWSNNTCSSTPMWIGNLFQNQNTIEFVSVYQYWFMLASSGAALRKPSAVDQSAASRTSPAVTAPSPLLAASTLVTCPPYFSSNSFCWLYSVLLCKFFWFDKRVCNDHN